MAHAINIREKFPIVIILNAVNQRCKIVRVRKLANIPIVYLNVKANDTNVQLRHVNACDTAYVCVRVRVCRRIHYVWRAKVGLSQLHIYMGLIVSLSKADC